MGWVNLGAADFARPEEVRSTHGLIAELIPSHGGGVQLRAKVFLNVFLFVLFLLI